MSLFFSVVPFLFSLFLAVFPGIETKVRRKKKDWEKEGRGKEGKSTYVCVCMNVMRMMPPVSGRPGISCLPPLLFPNCVQLSTGGAIAKSVGQNMLLNSAKTWPEFRHLRRNFSLPLSFPDEVCSSQTAKVQLQEKEGGGTERQQVDLT